MLTVNDLRIPRSWSIIAGADTGTYMGGAICAVCPRYELYVLEEFPNYHYTGDGTIELTGMTVGEWIKWFSSRLKHWTKERRVSAWVDANTTFKTEVGHGFRFKMNRKSLDLRTEILREYLRNRRLHLMPWLKVIPYEMEEAAFPEEETNSGKYVRIKKKDHCLDGVEHAASRRPHPDLEQSLSQVRHKMQAVIDRNRRIEVSHVDPHMGAL